jgi:peptidyl-tRNA hydrolase
LKQVIVVDESLRLPRGKLSAQVAHAAVEAFIAAPAKAREAWLRLGMPKVVLQGDSAEAVLALAEQAKKAGLPVALIEDAGKTVVSAGTITCVGIGPAEKEKIDRVTGSLQLVR